MKTKQTLISRGPEVIRQNVNLWLSYKLPSIDLGVNYLIYSFCNVFAFVKHGYYVYYSCRQKKPSILMTAKMTAHRFLHNLEPNFRLMYLMYS